MTASVLILAVLIAVTIAALVAALHDNRPARPPVSHPDWEFDRLPSWSYSRPRI